MRIALSHFRPRRAGGLCSMSALVDVPFGGEVGEGHACLGIDITPRSFTPGEEFLRVDYRPHNNPAGGFLAALSLFRSAKPALISWRENVRIFHNFKDARVVFRSVPSHSHHNDIHISFPGVRASLALGDESAEGGSTPSAQQPSPWRSESDKASVMEILRDFTLDDILSGVAFLICILAIPVVLAVL